MSSATPVLEVRSVGFVVEARRARTSLLDDVSLKVDPGTLHVVLGPNGAGKTTLLRVCVGELKPARGEILLAGEDARNYTLDDQAALRSYASTVAHVPFPYTAEEICRLGARDAPDSAVREVLELLDVDSLSDRVVSTLSGGELKRVLTARALLQLWDQPGDRVALLDEPTANLDPRHQHITMRALRAATARGIAVVMVVHDLNLATRYADAATLLRGGTVLSSGLADRAITDSLLSELFSVEISLIELRGLERPFVAVLG